MDLETVEEGLVQEEIGAEVEVVVTAAVITPPEAFEVVETVGCPKEASYLTNVCFDVIIKAHILNLKNLLLV